MGYYDDDNEREELLARFKESLSRPAAERYFDEDELVAVFDYAGDLNDDYVRTEVLLCGARLYPDSEALADRKALYYLDGDDTDMMAREYVAADQRSSLLCDIVRLQVQHPENPEEALAYLMDQYNDFGDEETIRFVLTAGDLGCYEWLKNKLPQLRKKANYTPVLLYEVMSEADRYGDNETVAALAEELIENEPFSDAYWMSLFQAQARLGREDDARNAFAYARELADDNLQLKLQMAETIYRHAPYLRAEAIDMIRDAASANPEIYAPTDCLAGLLEQGGRTDEAKDTVRRYFENHPSEYDAMRHLLAFDIDDAEQIVTQYLDANRDGIDDDDLTQLVHSLLFQGSIKSLSGLLTVVGSRQALDIDLLAPWIEALFREGRYDVVVAVFACLPDTEAVLSVPIRSLPIAAAVFMSMMLTGNDKAAAAFADNTRPTFESLMAESPLLVSLSARGVLALYDAAKVHTSADVTFWQKAAERIADKE